jgi:hypothetical protein
LEDGGINRIFFGIMKRKSRESQNQGNPDADKMSEAGLGGLKD